MPVHRQTLIDHRELKEARDLLNGAIDDLEARILERDVERVLERIEEVRQRADELEQTVLHVRR